MKNNFSIFLLSIVMVFVTGCGKSSSPNYVAPQQINDPTFSELPPTFEVQVERVNNCDGMNPNYTVSYTTIETQNATFEVLVEAGGLVTGTPVPQILQVELEAKISAALAKEYGIGVTRMHEITIVSPPGTDTQHMITWKVRRIQGEIEVIYGSETAKVAFSKIAGVELFNREPTSFSCDTSSAPAITPASTQIKNAVVAVKAKEIYLKAAPFFKSMNSSSHSYKQGTTFQILQSSTSEDGIWFYVNADGNLGWVWHGWMDYTDTDLSNISTVTSPTREPTKKPAYPN